MNTYTLKSDQLSVVILGSFNPAIYHPEWFARHDLISQPESEEASLEVCHPDITKFSTSWFELEVTQTRFLVTSNTTSRSEELRDLVLNVFAILCETPMVAIGINSTFEYSCSSVDAWHKVGHLLAPKNIWLSPFPNLIEQEVGMRSVEIEYPRQDGLPGFYRVSVTPTKPVPSPCFAFKVNSHVELGEIKNTTVTKLLSEKWEEIVGLSCVIVKEVLRGIDDQGDE
ncbi:MAG: hypothetical protein JKX92_13585 [Porticoccaceae bacterium]|nr:hypothetical protein [Porticoccaceae bacterium]